MDSTQSFNYMEFVPHEAKAILRAHPNFANWQNGSAKHSTSLLLDFERPFFSSPLVGNVC